MNKEISSPIVLGVDGGGTKTHYALFHADGAPIDFLTSGATNHEALDDGFAGTERRLRRDLLALTSRNKIQVSDIDHAVLGLAGVDTRRQHVILSEVLRTIGLKNFILCNDSFLGVKAGCPSGYGICAINGTGFSIGGINGEGKLVQIGGFGDLSGDMGGGGSYAIWAFQAVYEQLYKDAPATTLTQYLFQAGDIKDPTDFPERLLSGLAERNVDFTTLGHYVFDAAEKGDVVSQNLILRSTKEYARSISAAISRLELDRAPGKTVEVTLAGSVFVKGYSEEQLKTLQGLIQQAFPEQTIVLAKLFAPPVMGALIWAMAPYLKTPEALQDMRKMLSSEIAVLLKR